MTQTLITLTAMTDGPRPNTKLLTFSVAPDSNPRHVGLLNPGEQGSFQWLIDNPAAFPDFVAGAVYLMSIEKQNPDPPAAALVR